MVSSHLSFGLLIVAVLGNTNQSRKERRDPFMNRHRSSFNTSHNSKTKTVSRSDQCFGQCGFYSSNVNSSHQEAMLYVFENNEAVIKMIIKGRSPIMRHVSRTHRVALDWLFDRINLDLKNPNQIHRHQKPTHRHSNQREISRVMNGIICCV